jgi:hypothetical protein
VMELLYFEPMLNFTMNRLVWLHKLCDPTAIHPNSTHLSDIGL